jgi:glycosyltransferase 2 family protein
VKRKALIGAKVAVSLALLAYLLSTTDLGTLHDRFRRGDTMLLALGVVLYTATLAIATWRWRMLLHAQGYQASLGRLGASYLVATFFNNFLPSNIGGDVIRVRDSSAMTGSTTTSLAIVAIDRILGLGALYLLALGAWLLGPPALRGLAGATPVLALMGVVFVTLAYVFFRPGIARRIMAATRLNTLRWAREKFEVVQEAVHVYRQEVGYVWGAFGASVALQTLIVFFYWDVAQSLLIPLPLLAAFLIVPLCALVQTVPVSFNGWGIRESVFIVYFRQLGLARESALAFSLAGAGLIALLSLPGAIVWSSRVARPNEPPAGGPAPAP